MWNFVKTPKFSLLLRNYKQANFHTNAPQTTITLIQTSI